MNEKSRALIIGMCQKVNVIINNIYKDKGLRTISEAVTVEVRAPTLRTISEAVTVEADILFAESEE